MILINGKETKLQTGQFSNLEEMLLAGFETCTQQQQIITDVILNDEPFSELYPHQAEDISASQVNKLEIISVNLTVMALDVVVELYKVTRSMELGSIQCATHFRHGDDALALTLLQDLISVNRDFMNILSTLRKDFEIPEHETLTQNLLKYSELLSELIDVTESEDWVLLADLLEFEVAPACVEWNTCLDMLKLYFATDEQNEVTQ